MLAGSRVIIGAEILALRHRLLKRGPVRLALLVVLLGFAAIFIGGGSFSLGVAAARYLPQARDPILAAGFTALAVLMFVLGFPTVIASLFVGRDLLQLVLAPVRPVDIFIARMVLAMIANLLISSLLLAGALGVGVGSGASPVFYVLAVPLVITQVLVVTAFQALLMSIVLRWIPARLARDFAAGIAGLTGAGFYIAWNVNLRQSFESRTRVDFTNAASFIQQVGWLPPTWPAHALSGVIDGSAGAGAGWTVLTLALAGLVATAAALLYGRTLLAGLGVFGGAAMTWRRPKQRPAAVARAGAGSPLRAIARKDWLAYRRDIRRLSRLLPALLFPIGYAFAFSRPSKELSGFWSEVFLIAFISMFMSTTLGTPSVPSERRGFQLLRMAPLPMWQVIRAKVALTLPAVLVMTVVFGLIVALVERNPVSEIVELIALGIWLGLGFVAVGVSAGAIDPRFESSDDRRAVGMVGTLAGVGGALGFGALSIGAFALLVFAAGALAGTAHLGSLPSTPAIGALLGAAALVLAAGAATLVGALLWAANASLVRFEDAIAAT
ncbi:MAG TPA: hypothetical protein VMW11_07810 [Candidatus Dormibacteraeota bacterium]|nr:hypothetical protein [Candidatus Dormibacteraeota bacterium]